MKKHFLILAMLSVFFLPSINTAKAQTDNFELGARFDGGYIFGASLDAMIPMGANRLHGNLSFGGWGLGASIIYDWQHVFGNGVNGHGEWLWYPGIGAGFSVWDGGYWDDYNGGFGLSVISEFGIEYQFDFPLSLGVDVRPSIGLGNGNDGFGFYVSSGLNVRYRF